MDEANIKLAEHLRMVHFTLVLVVATLLIATIERSGGDPQKDLTTIVNMVDKLEPEAEKYRSFDPGVLESPLRDVIPSRSFFQEYLGTSKIFDNDNGIETSITISFTPPIATVFHSKSDSEWSGLQGKPGAYSDFFFAGRPRYSKISPSVPEEEKKARITGLGAEGPWQKFQRPSSSTKQFMAFWDAISKMRHAYLFDSLTEPKAFRVSSDNEKGALNIRQLGSPLRNAPKFNSDNKYIVPASAKWKNLKVDQHRENADSLIASEEILTVDHTWAEVGYSEFYRRLLALYRPTNDDFKQIYEFREMLPGDIIVIATAKYLHQPLDIQEHFLLSIHDEQRKHGSFHTSFPHLNSYIENFGYDGHINFDLLNHILEHEKKKGGSPLEIAGLKINRYSLHYWGIVVVLAIQLYFLLHFRELSNRIQENDSALRVAWLGLYPGLFAYVVFFSTVVLLPIIVSCLVAWIQLGVSGIWVPNLFLSLLSIYLGFLTYRPAIGLRHIINSPSKI